MSSDDTALVITLSLIILVNWFTMTTITSLSFDLRSGPMMSILISYHGSLDVSNGWSSSTFFIYCTLFYWHFWHHWTYFFMLFHIPSHQSFLLINLSILYCSGSFLSYRPLCCPPMLVCLLSLTSFVPLIL